MAMIPFCRVLNGLGHVHLDVVLCFYQVKDWAVALGHLHPHHHLREEEAVEEHHLSCGARHLYPFPHQETEVGHSPRQLGLEEMGAHPHHLRPLHWRMVVHFLSPVVGREVTELPQAEGLLVRCHSVVTRQV